MYMMKRLQVLFDDHELSEIQHLAKRRHMTTAEWVRASLRAAREAESGSDLSEKLAAVRRAVAHSFPVGDIDQVLEEIERGYTESGRA
jgi:hypothetical protein